MEPQTPFLLRSHPQANETQDGPVRKPLRIVILGAGVQGTIFAVRLAMAGHQVTFISRADRAKQLNSAGAVIQDVTTLRTWTVQLPVLERLPGDLAADICLVTVRREQIESVLPELAQATAIQRIVFLVNHAHGSQELLTVLGRSRVVLAFPGLAGAFEGNTVRYLDIPQQRTAVEAGAHDVVSLFREAGLSVERVADMDAWLQRHAVFITAMAGALYENGGDALQLARNFITLRRLLVGVREGWAAQDRKRLRPAPFGLRVIMGWVPMWLAARYWSRLLASDRGEIYFAKHTRHAPAEMAALANDVRGFLRKGEAPELESLLASIDGWTHPPREYNSK
jgi:2-dehydropantoate 2-reductase